MKRGGKSVITPSTNIAVIYSNCIFRESLCLAIEERGKYGCIPIDLSKKNPKDFPIRGAGLHILGYGSENNPRLLYPQEIINPIMQSDETRLLFIIPCSERVLEFAIKSGADGCVSLEDRLDILHIGIDMVLSGESYCSPSLTKPLYQKVRNNSNRNNDWENLSPRELEVVDLICQGFSNKKIARELHISLHTVKNHVHNIIEKLNVEDRHEVAREAQGSGVYC